MLINLQDPFKRAEIWLRHRKEAKLQESSIWKSLLVIYCLPCPAWRIQFSKSLLMHFQDCKDLIHCQSRGAS